jgi:hypothetical protein
MGEHSTDMPKWEQWIDDDFEDDLELVEDYQSFEPIKRRKKSIEDEDSRKKGKKDKNNTPK